MTRRIKDAIASLLIIAIVTAINGLVASAEGQTGSGNQERARQGGSDRRISELTGTYRLDETRSDNVRAVVDRATSNLPPSERDRIRIALMNRVASPGTLAIDQRGQTVTIASSLGPATTVTADGRTQYGPGGRGADMGVRALFQNDQLVIDTTSSRGNEYMVTFDPVDRGSNLRVTRRINVQELSRPIVIQSVYRKTSDIAQLDIYRGTDSPRQVRYGGSFLVPNGTQLVTTLNTRLDTRRAREGDRFTMTVESPRAYKDAIIEGFVSDVDRAGRIRGRADMTLNFQRIRLRNGNVHNFAAQIIGVRTPGGDDVRVDFEGRLEERDSQTRETLRRTGIGSAIGAVIGAIAGGGSGAAIGAAVGAGGGFGSIFITGRDDLQLPSGTRFVIRAASPRTI